MGATIDKKPTEGKTLQTQGIFCKRKARNFKRRRQEDQALVVLNLVVCNFFAETFLRALWRPFAPFWESAKVSHKSVFTLLTPEIHSYEMAQMLQKPVFALPGCQRMSVNTLLCDTLALADLLRLFCALRRPFAPVCALLRTCVCALLCSFALFCVSLRPTALERPCLGPAKG